MRMIEIFKKLLKWHFDPMGKIDQISYLWAFLVVPAEFILVLYLGATYDLSWILILFLIPFWLSIISVLKRLRDIGLSLWWLFSFFIPVVNIVLALSLILRPSEEQT